MEKFTFLTEEEISGSKKLDVIEKRGLKAAITDFAILLGGFVSNDYHIDGKSGLEDRTGFYWTKTDDRDNDARAVWNDGLVDYGLVDLRSVGIRPALTFSSISEILTNRVSERAKDGIYEIVYGYYPKTAVDKKSQKKLEREFEYGNLTKLQDPITTDSRKYNEYDKIFEPQELYKYEYNGNIYVRVKANSYFDGKYFTLSNGEKYKDGDIVWVKVEPNIVLASPKDNKAVFKNIIFAGAQFNHIRNYHTKDFDNTDIKKYMDKYLIKDLCQNTNSLQNIGNLNLQEIQKNSKYMENPYNFNFQQVSEEDIIKGAIESNIAVFLHGKSSDGKSSRVKQLDPDCEIIYMVNATPESLNGKSVYTQSLYQQRKVPIIEVEIDEKTGEKKEKTDFVYENVLLEEAHMIDIKPSWLIKLEEKCEREPDKIHIVFFDELTNAAPAIQKLAFNIVLDKEVNGKWKLPKNSRIVAAGNEMTDSISANQLAEPLFNRFAHVYINTTVDSWLKWASTPPDKYERLDYEEENIESKIHPSIYAFVAYKSYSGKDILRTPYTGDKPNADPRKWEMASKVLFKTKQPNMLRALIGEDLTADFIEFCSTKVITVENVINGNYSQSDLEMNVSQQFATAVGLSSVDEEHFEIVRDFMKQVGAEPRAAFESMWIHGDKKRLEKLAEIKISDRLSERGRTL